MKRSHGILLAGLMLALVLQATAQRKEVIGYYPSWTWRMEKTALPPERIPFEKLTIINYAFFYPLPDGSIAGRDTVGDGKFLRAAPGSRLTDLAHRKHVKVLLSLGGWEDSGNFPVVAATSPLRAAFAHSCINAIRAFGFDGIDIDWEYPGFADHKGTREDKRNFTLLLQTLRDSLRAHGTATGTNYLLTAAFPATAQHLADVEMNNVSAILDQVNVMSYDFYGPWDSLSNHNSPLYPSAGADSARCFAAAFRLFHRTLGIPSSKINMGVPFYGHAYAHCAGLNARSTGVDTVHFSRSGAFYADIVRTMASYTRRWDNRARVPYLVSPAWNTFVSYDDEQSIRAKAKYIMDNRIHGCIIWEITGDNLPDGSTPLLNALESTFH